MNRVDRGTLRKLAEWDGVEVPITSLYLTVDGRRLPKKSDWEVRLDELLRRARAETERLDRDAARSVRGDLQAISGFLLDEFDRGDTRGIAIFSCSASGLWEMLRVTRPVRDRVVVGRRADLLPLEALLETYRPTCVALVDYEKARLFVVELGRIEEITDLRDDVPGRHDQGGWAQMRMQRHVDDHRTRHLRHVADVLFSLSRRRPFDHLVLAGPAEAHRAIDPYLHDYLRKLVRASITLPMTATSSEVLARALEVEESAERERERAVVERILAAASANAHGVLGLEPTLEAMAGGRVGELILSIDLSSPGVECETCGRLSTKTGPCRTCGSATEPVGDVVDAAVTAALRGGSHVEVLGETPRELEGIGALLRF
jgi:peptide chain release factor subunit 1